MLHTYVHTYVHPRVTAIRCTRTDTRVCIINPRDPARARAPARPGDHNTRDLRSGAARRRIDDAEGGCQVLKAATRKTRRRWERAREAEPETTTRTMKADEVASHLSDNTARVIKGRMWARSHSRALIGFATQRRAAPTCNAY